MRIVIDDAQLKTFKISNHALTGAALPTRLKIFSWGDNPSTKGNYRAGKITAAVLSANQKREGFDRVAIDFDHCTVRGTAAYNELMKNGQPPIIFGYGDVTPVEDDGIFLENIVWTPLGLQRAKNFEDLSPALLDEGGEVTMIHSVALTPNGSITDLNFFNTSPGTPASGTASPNQNQNANHPMKKPITPEELVPVLGLKTDSKREDVLSRLGLISTLAALFPDGKLVAPEELTTLTAGLGDRLKKIEDAGTKAIATLSATIGGKVLTFSAEDLVQIIPRLDALESGIKTGQAATLNALRDDLVATFAAEGKVPKKPDGSAFSADELKKLEVGTLQILSANTPVSVALAERSRTGLTDGAQKKFTGKDGKVDMAGLLDAEAAAGS